MRIIYLFTAVFLLCFKGYAQISFPNCLNGIETCTPCNVFKPTACPNFHWGCPTVTANSTHGSPQNVYEPFGNVVMLQASNAVAGGSKSEGFIINYNFKSSYRYQFNVRADMPPSYRLPVVNNTKLYLQLTNSLSAGGTNTCDLGAKPVPTGNFTQEFNIFCTSNGSYGMSTASVTIPAGVTYSQLFMFSRQDVTGNGAVAVQSIDIVEIRPEFTLTPAAITVACANTTAQTFTISNPSSIAGTLSYKWTVGAGWLYNGQPAPASITTTTNTLTLTPTGTSAPSDISVAVLINGVAYGTYLSKITFNSDPGAVISGPKVVCTSGIFQLSNSNISNIAWTGPSSTIATLTTNANNTVTLTRVGDDYAPISATFQACGNTFTVTARPVAGFPYGSVTMSGVSEASNGGIFDYRLLSTAIPLSTNLSNLTWQVPSGWTVLSYYPATQGVQVQAGSQPGYMTAAATVCGLTRGITKYVTIGGGVGSRIGATATEDVLVYPNPLANNVTVDISKSDTKERKTTGFKIMIYDLNNNLVKTESSNANVRNFNVQQLRPGNYILQIIIDGKKISRQIIIHD